MTDEKAGARQGDAGSAGTREAAAREEVEWAGCLAPLASELPPAPGASGVVELAVAVDRLEVRAHWSYEDGKPSEGAVGSAASPDLVLTIPAAEASAILAGRLSPSVAYMRGRLKSTGDNGLLLAVLASTAGPAFAKWLERARASLAAAL